MRIKVFISLLIIVAGISCAFLVSIGDFFTETKTHQATKEAERELTRSYGIEVRLAIERYHIRAGFSGFYRNPDELSTVVTEPYLDRLLSNEGYATKAYLMATQQISMSDVRVLDYTPTRFIAIGCGVIHEDKTTLDGKFVESLPPQKIENIYVFSQVNGRWKLLVAYDFQDPKSLIRDLEHAIGWEKEYGINDLIDYFPRDYRCSVR